MNKYLIVLVFLVGCGSDSSSDREYFETVENCTVYTDYTGTTTEYCDIVVVNDRNNPEVPEPVFD